MTESILYAFKCTSQDPTSSRMFTPGKIYPVRRHGYAAGSGWITDNLGRQRFISTGNSFIVENNSGRSPGPDVRHAYFEPINGACPECGRDNSEYGGVCTSDDCPGNSPGDPLCVS